MRRAGGRVPGGARGRQRREGVAPQFGHVAEVRAAAASRPAMVSSPPPVLTTQTDRPFIPAPVARPLLHDGQRLVGGQLVRGRGPSFVGSPTMASPVPTSST